MSRPWMPLYVADYQADTAHLSTTEHGAYLLLIMFYWTKGKLPGDEEAIRRVTRMTSRQWSQSRDVLRSLFGADWRHKRIDEELGKAIEKSKVNSANAKRSHSNRSANADRSHTQSQSQSEEDTEAKASGTAPPAPVYTDSKHELWGEGRTILISLGVSERQAGAMIGSWLKTTGDDAQAVLGAIQRARDHRVHNPIPWITNSLKGSNNERSGSVFSNSSTKQSGSTAVFAGVAAAAERRARERESAGQQREAHAAVHLARRADPDFFGTG